MLHSFRDNEIYVIKEGTGKQYNATKEYTMTLGYEVVRGTHRLDDYEHRNIPTCAPLTFHTPIHRLNDTLQIITKGGTLKTIYQFGQYLWFDTEQEREEYRTQYWAEQNALKELNAIKKVINEKLAQMSKEQLEQLLATL